MSSIVPRIWLVLRLLLCLLEKVQEEFFLVLSRIKATAMSMQIYLSSSLGSGRFGTVFRGDYHGTPVAVKVVGATPASRTKFSPEENNSLNQECEVMRKCIHANIVQYLQSTEVNIQDFTFPALVMTLMETDLRKFVGYASIDLPPHKEVKIAHDVAKALNYLHAWTAKNCSWRFAYWECSLTMHNSH